MATAASSLRFTRVKLTNWRNFRSAEVRLRSRAFLVGPNASGKSNFIDALRFLRDLARPTGGLAVAFAARKGFSAIRCLEARDPSHLEIDVDVGTDDEPARWSYQLRMQRHSGEKYATVAEEVARGRGKIILNRSRPKQAPDPQIYTQTYLEQVAQNEQFRELAQFFASVRYLHVVPQIVRDARRVLNEEEDPYGGDLLRRIKETPKKTREPRLRRIQAALQIAVPQFRGLELRDDSEGRPHLYAAYTHWRPNASMQSEEVFSDGMLRLVGFLWSIAEKGGPLLLEEPELSLNDAVVQQLPRMMARAQRLSGRQVIATTHSAAMLDAEGVTLDEVHRIVVGKNGSVMETAANNPQIVAQVEEGRWTAGQAVLPLTQPKTINDLGRLDVVAG